MRKIIGTSLTLFALFLFLSPEVHADFTTTCGDISIITPDNNDPGDEVLFTVHFLDSSYLTSSYTFAWGTSLSSTTERKVFSTTMTNSKYEITTSPLGPESPQTAWLFNGSYAYTDLSTVTGDILCETGFLVGDTSGGTPGLPKDERTLFSCRDETGVNQECVDCINANGRWTILGCLPKGQGSFVQVILNLVTGIAGGISFLVMLKGAFLLMTSQGDPNQVQSGKSSLTKGAAGLLIIVFATVILRILAGDIINIPGFG